MKSELLCLILLLCIANAAHSVQRSSSVPSEPLEISASECGKSADLAGIDKLLDAIEADAHSNGHDEAYFQHLLLVVNGLHCSLHIHYTNREFYMNAVWKIREIL